MLRNMVSRMGSSGFSSVRKPLRHGAFPRSLPLPSTVVRRAYSTGVESPKSRLSPLFTLLIVGGAGLTAYGLYDLYGVFTIWPQELRDDLKEGLKAKYGGDYFSAEFAMSRAWEKVKSFPTSVFGEDPYLKITGVATALADVHEQQNHLSEAYSVYADALQMLQAVKEDDLSAAERLRAVALAHKLGALAVQLEKPDAEQEKWLVYAVETVLKLSKDESLYTPPSNDERVVVAELQLPPWISNVEIGAPLEALGGFYARTGKIEFAMPLYLQAISMLIPPPPNQSPPEDRCRGAQLMGNLSELILRSNNPDKLQQAEVWAKKGLSILHGTRTNTPHQIPICEVSYAVALFNVGVLREMAGDRKVARECYSSGLEHSRNIGMERGVQEAETALQRLDAAEAQAN